MSGTSALSRPSTLARLATTHRIPKWAATAIVFYVEAPEPCGKRLRFRIVRPRARTVLFEVYFVRQRPSERVLYLPALSTTGGLGRNVALAIEPAGPLVIQRGLLCDGHRCISALHVLLVTSG
jgi:hypothetical protein